MSTLTIALGDTKQKCSGKITDRIKTFDDACRELGLDPSGKVTIDASSELEGDLKSIAAYARLTIIARALNEGWKPDWTNDNERKWWPYFEYKSGFGFSGTICDGWRTNTSVGSRLCYKSEALAEYAAKQFADIYNDFLTL